MDPQGLLSPAPCFLQNYLQVNLMRSSSRHRFGATTRRNWYHLVSHIFSLDPFLILTYFIKPLVFWHNTGQFQLYLNFFNIINLASISQLKKPNQPNKQTLFFSFLCSLFSKTISDMQGIVDAWILIVFTNIKIPETSGYIDELLNGSKMDLHCVTSYWVTNV